MAVLEIEDLRKTYDGRAVVDGVSLSVGAGEVLGVLGRNGAGKTTTVECGVGLRRPDGGRVRVLGADPWVERARVQQVVGVQLQRAAVHPSLTVAELVRMRRSFHHDGLDPDELIERLGLADVRRTRAEHLSGGQHQRLAIALALVGRPRLAVLDELTTGLDAVARRGIWGLVEDMRADGIAIVLVTHGMEEAERLCDRVAVLDAGRVVAHDTPAGLVARVAGAQRMSFRAHGPVDRDALAALPGVGDVVLDGDRVTVTGRGDLVREVTAALLREDVPMTDVRTRTATLDDAFLQLTGHEPEVPETVVVP